MKANHQRKTPTFGAFIMAVYDAMGKRRAKGIVHLAVKARLVEFRGQRRIEFF